MRIDDDRKRLDMTTEAASWVWKNDQEGYDLWLEAIMRDMPEGWDADDSAEGIVVAYVRHLERLVTAAYGSAGLERDHEGVAETITALQEMNTIRDWVKTNLPHVDTSEGVAKPVVGLLHITKSGVDSILPVFQSIVSTFGQQFRALGLYKETR
jgi:hypothetical protein